MVPECDEERDESYHNLLDATDVGDEIQRCVTLPRYHLLRQTHLNCDIYLRDVVFLVRVQRLHDEVERLFTRVLCQVVQHDRLVLKKELCAGHLKRNRLLDLGVDG